MIVRGPIDRDGASETAMRWLVAHPEATAVFAATDELPIRLLHAAAKLDATIPRALAVIGFDGVPERTTTVPELATIIEPFERIGREAITELLRTVPSTNEVVLPVSLAPSTSCGCSSTSSMGSRGF